MTFLASLAFDTYSHHFNYAGFCQTWSSPNQQVAVSQNGDKEFSEEIGLPNNLLAEPAFQTGYCSACHMISIHSDVPKLGLC